MDAIIEWFTWHWFPFWIGMLTIYFLTLIKFILLKIPGVRIIVLLFDGWKNRKNIKDAAVSTYNMAQEAKVHISKRKKKKEQAE